MSMHRQANRTVVGSSPIPRRRRLAFGATVAGAVLGLGLLGAEAAFRSIDRYSLKSARLVRLAAPVATIDGLTASYVDRLPIAAGIDRAWFARSPPVVARWNDKDLEKRYWGHPGYELAAVYEWNEEYLRSVACEQPAFYEAAFKPVDEVFAYAPKGSGRTPTFRFLRSSSMPSGLVTNAYGWRGPDIALEKPKGTVRIAYVGSSTTVNPHGDPFSYPDYIREWLAAWAASRHPDVRFEVINAGREGVMSSTIAAIVHDEVAPVDPDLVVYYEGSNQFWPAYFVKWPKDGVPPRRTVAVPAPALWTLHGHSALVVRLEGLIDRLSRWREPDKLVLDVQWPASLKESDPQLDHPELPLDLPRILKDFDTMRSDLQPAGGRLAVSSFVWCVFGGMRLDPAADAILYQYLNTTFWPFPYAHMRRMADFQNRVFTKYAKARGIDFLDVAHDYPLDPRLFGDAVHMTPLGVKLMAWTSFQRLVPIVERRIAAGEWPKPTSLHLSRHPAFDQPTRRVVRLSTIRASCGDADKTSTSAAVGR